MCPTIKQSCTIITIVTTFHKQHLFSTFRPQNSPANPAEVHVKSGNYIFLAGFFANTFFSFVDSLNRNVLRYVWCMPKHKQARRFVLSSLHVVLPLLCVVDLIESCCCCFYLNIYFLFRSQFATLKKFAGGRDSHPIGTLRVCFRILSPPVKAIQKFYPELCVENCFSCFSFLRSLSAPFLWWLYPIEKKKHIR